ncbi:MAG TPA: Ku protein [Steroidobacteraceae bacterium]|nr:Ku protein [Steroidobacteraceae bacterium]
MAARSIASLSISFGLVSIPIKLYSATESSAAIRFKLMTSSGAHVRQQYVTESLPPVMEEEPPVEEPAPELERPVAKSRDAASKVVDFPTARQTVVPPTYEESAPTADDVIERSTMVKGFEFKKGKFVLFTPEELKALEAGSRQTIDIVSFIPENAVDPIYYNKAYFLAPDKRGSKPYNLLARAMRDTGRCALAKWAFRSKEYIAQIRAAHNGLVLQQLFYAEEVRSFTDLHIEPTDVGDAELKLAKQLIAQISADSYDPTEFVDEEKTRILAAVEEKISGKQIAAPAHAPSNGGQVVDLLEALRASLQGKQGRGETANGPRLSTGERKPIKRATSKAADVRAASSKGRSSRK